MEIPSHELQAFLMLAQTLNFSVAAEKVCISQSALSQRIQSLEKKLGLILFIRDRKAIKLTEASMKLLRYCQIKKHLETELLNDLAIVSNKMLGGYLRIAAFSSVLHSVIIPALAPLIRENSTIRFEFSRHDVSDLPNVLMSAEADFVIMDYCYQKDNLQIDILGYENYVLIQSSDFPVRDIYLDHNINDNTTHQFFKTQGVDDSSHIKSYVDDIEGILKGVSLGLGQGVVPVHLLNETLPIKQVKGMKPLRVPVILHYFKQPYYSRLQEITIKTLQERCVNYLI